MRNAKTILTVIQTRGSQKLPLERLYKLLYNKELYLLAYSKLYPNSGAMTKGVNDETVDSMSIAKIEKLIDDIRHERYQWNATRRVYIPKKDGKQRPLGIPTWSDKLLQEVIRMILEAYYEPQFSKSSHGFRPKRGCHTALSEIQTWKGTKWFIEGDISKYFDTIDHNVLLEMLSNNIKDNRFLRLIDNLLKAGYLEDWKYNKTISGTPQGGVISPLLANIYLNKFDKWVETVLIPKYTKGIRQKANPPYSKLNNEIAKCKENGDFLTAKKLKVERRNIPSIDTKNADYRRLRYTRYADDFILGFNGTKEEAQNIKAEIAMWIKMNLKLELSEKKTLITHASTTSARFLGYDIKVQMVDDYVDPTGRRGANGVIVLFVPSSIIEKKCAEYMKKGKPIHIGKLLQDDDFSIVQRFGAEYRGIVQYYLMAQNVSWLYKLHWIMQGSLLKTLAYKHKTTMCKISKKYSAETVDDKTGKTLKCLKVAVERKDKQPLTAQFGGISLTHKEKTVIDDKPYKVWGGRTEILKRLLADTCELCGSNENIEVHHIRKLADLNTKGKTEKPIWIQIMATRNRKTLVVCRNCHNAIHNGSLK